jgi:ACT domain-containing protein
MKEKLIKKIKDIVIERGNVEHLDVQTHIGDAYAISYSDAFDCVEVDIITGPGEGIKNPSTIMVGIEYLDEKDIEKILKSLENE